MCAVYIRSMYFLPRNVCVLKGRVGQDTTNWYRSGEASDTLDRLDCATSIVEGHPSKRACRLLLWVDIIARVFLSKYGGGTTP